ncbi:MAG: hypothetical protein WBA73_16450 [Devosia sp.]
MTVHFAAPVSRPAAPTTLVAMLDRFVAMTGPLHQLRKSARMLKEVLCSGEVDWFKDRAIRGNLGGLALGSLRHATIYQLRSDYAARFDGKAEKRFTTALALVFKAATLRHWMSANPALHQPPVPARNSQRVEAYRKRAKRLDMPVESEVAVFLSDCEDWVALGDWVSIHAGLRSPETRGLPWQNVTLWDPVPNQEGELAETGGHLVVEHAAENPKKKKRSSGRSKMSGKRKDGLDRTKSPSGRREVVFGPELAAELRRRRPPEGRWNEFVVSPDGKIVSAYAMREARRQRQYGLKVARRAKNAKGIWCCSGYVEARKLRHVFAARKIAEGIHHADLCRLMGHRFHWITLNIYGYLFREVEQRRMRERAKG